MPTPSGLTNAELVEFLELPSDIVDDLKTAQGSTYTAKANEFLSALYNKVLYQTVASMEFTNPFKKYDSFPITYGDTVENIFVEMPKGYKFSNAESDPFKKATPSVKALYSSINYELQYETTVEDSLLRRACLSEYGFMNLIDTIIAQLGRAMSLDEYTATLATLNNEDIFAKGIETYSEGSTDSETAETVTKTIIDAVSYMKLPGTASNKMGVLTSSKPEDILLIIKADLLNKINLDYLSGVYNLSKVDLVNQIIPVVSFQTETTDSEGETSTVGDDIDFMVIDVKGFDNHVALQDGGLIYNPKGKYTNHFYNLWKIISFKHFYNARAWKKAE